MVLEPLLECFVLVPSPHEPVVLRLDRRAGIGQVKAALERKRGWPASQQRLMLESGLEVEDAHTLMSLRLHKQDAPTLMLELDDPAPKRMRTSGPALTAAAAALVSRAVLQADEQAAVDIQRAIRGKSARREVSEQVLRLALREACARTELRFALRIQRLWRQAEMLRQTAQQTRVEQAARMIQGEQRSRQLRLCPKRHQAQWLKVAEAEVDQESFSFSDTTPLAWQDSAAPKRWASAAAPPASTPPAVDAIDEVMDLWPQPPSRSFSNSSVARQVIGVVEKETGFRSMGSWQLVTWKRRFMYTTPDALCYRHVGLASQMPRGKTTAVAYSTMQRVGVHADEPTVLLIECEQRQYFFRLQSVAQCERWAAIITVAASQCD